MNCRRSRPNRSRICVSGTVFTPGRGGHCLVWGWGYEPGHANGIDEPCFSVELAGVVCLQG